MNPCSRGRRSTSASAYWETEASRVRPHPERYLRGKHAREDWAVAQHHGGHVGGGEQGGDLGTRTRARRWARGGDDASSVDRAVAGLSLGAVPSACGLTGPAWPVSR